MRGRRALGCSDDPPPARSQAGGKGPQRPLRSNPELMQGYSCGFALACFGLALIFSTYPPQFCPGILLAPEGAVPFLSPTQLAY